MVHIAHDGKLRRIDNVMSMTTFADIKPRMPLALVKRTLGPEVTSRTAYFARRDELV